MESPGVPLDQPVLGGGPLDVYEQAAELKSLLLPEFLVTGGIGGGRLPSNPTFMPCDLKRVSGLGKSDTFNVRLGKKRRLAGSAIKDAPEL
ncbi:hypothetical protein M427DRAFT_33304 [Gonapodya prolifera JEL478]|uniref:Uncharacterized protein n=1 Tax=Gonapodya prolifera (strain JEL478) TaxID=1344416 RepID=A0A139ABF4_GONPJ|nr:hypothetical protein M427DRAFT_33304 [Gonapodya prolifera JEL478]|eukprot:KXS14090.1 hypothetical protein M427DRAFT_33304 [Gonapodya prolifera JEL478]